MKRYFYLFIDNGTVKYGFCNGSKFEDIIEQLMTNAISPLFICTYTHPLSRYITKYLMSLVDLSGETLSGKIESEKEWVLNLPYLYYDTNKYGYVMDKEMLFQPRLSLIGYCPNKTIQELLVKQD